MWQDGVRARVTGRRNGSVRLALDQLTDAWVALSEVAWLPGVTLAEWASVGTVRLAGAADRVSVRVALSQPAPYHVEVSGRRLTLILYGAYSNTDWLRYGQEDPFVEAVRWEQVTSDRYLLHFDLAAAPWGYRVRHLAGGLQLDIRKPPPIDPRRPFEGLEIVLDPGHPPGGATGPTRLTEADANLAVAFRLKRLLEDEGAKVVLARADRSAVRIYDRTALAELLDAHILISIHNNALPDGVNPFENHGTSVYYFHPHALDLARELQRGLLSSMGLPDLGFGRASLALARPAWVMAALTEGAFMMIPEQEAGLRTPVFQEAYAKGIRDGILRFLLERAE
jgi:N-acetylmuramoyl-L-alanine amidase